jgi:hypothetical protein
VILNCVGVNLLGRRSQNRDLFHKPPVACLSEAKAWVWLNVSALALTAKNFIPLCASSGQPMTDRAESLPPSAVPESDLVDGLALRIRPLIDIALDSLAALGLGLAHRSLLSWPWLGRSNGREAVC